MLITEILVASMESWLMKAVVIVSVCHDTFLIRTILEIKFVKMLILFVATNMVMPQVMIH